MEQTVNHLNLDVSKNDAAINEPVKLRQTDKGSHTIEATITNHQKAYDLTNVIVEFNATKPDGNIIVDHATIKDASKGIVDYTTNEQLVAVAGTFNGYFVIKNGNNVIDSTSSFPIIVEDAVSINAVSGSYIKTVEELVTSLQKQVDDGKAKAQNDLNAIVDAISKVKTDMNAAVQAAKDYATQQAIATLQAKLDKLLESVNSTKQQLEQYASTAKNTMQQTLTDADNLKHQIEDRKNSAQSTLDSLNSIKNTGANVLSKFQADTTQALSTLATNVDNLVKKAIADNSAAFKDLEDKGKANNDKLANLSNAWQSTLDAYKQTAGQSITDFSNDSIQKLGDVERKFNSAISDFNTKAQRAIDDFKTNAGSIINVKSVNGIKPDNAGNIHLQQTVVTSYNVAQKAAGTELRDVKPDQEWLVDQTALGNIADQINQLKGRQTLDNPDFNAIKETGVYYITKRNDNQQYNDTFPANSWGTLVVFNAQNNRIVQLFFRDNGNWMFYRVSNSNQQWTFSWTNLNTPNWENIINKPWFNYSLFNGNVHWNPNSNQFEWFTKNYTSNSVQNGGTMAIDLDDDDALKATAAKLTDINNKANISIPLIQGKEGDDLLNLPVNPAFYEFLNINNTVNNPLSGNTHWFKVINLANDNWGIVILWSQDTGTQFINTRNSGNWGIWKKTVNSGDLDNVSNRINTLQAQVTALQNQPARGFTDVDGVHHDVKYLTQQQYDALSTKDPNTLYITPES